MKDKIIEILKEFSTVEDDDGLTCHVLSGFFFYKIAKRIDSLYTPEISEERIDELVEGYAENLSSTERPNIIFHAKWDFRQGLKAALKELNIKKI